MIRTKVFYAYKILKIQLLLGYRNFPQYGKVKKLRNIDQNGSYIFASRLDSSLLGHFI